MEVVFSARFKKSYDAASEQVRTACDKQIGYLLDNLNHPSLRAKKYDEKRGIWQARVNQNWRFYFHIEEDTYYCIDIVVHPK